MRRRFFFALLPMALFAKEEPRKAAIEVLRRASRALNAGNAGLFLRAFDKQATARFAAIQNNVVALCATRGIASSIQVNELREEEGQFRARVDWLLQLTAANGLGPVETRRETVVVALRMAGKRWRIVGWEPVAFLAAGHVPE